MEPFPPPTVLSDPPHDQWLSWSRSDTFLEIRVRRSLVFGVLISLILNGALVYFFLMYMKERIEAGGAAAPIAPRSLAVRLGPEKATAPPRSEPTPETPPKPVEEHLPPQPRERQRTVMTVRGHSTQSVPVTPPTPPAAPPAPAQPPTDMMAMVNASRERRHQEDENAARENAAAEAAEAEPSADQIAQANIKRNLESVARQNRGESGIFQIRSLGIRTATFSFKGWTTDESRSTLQIIDVDAGPGGDVKRAVVRRMIELIRTHYTGDFNFDSHRLGRIVVQSARIQDNDKLEAFLLLEFFGS